MSRNSEKAQSMLYRFQEQQAAEIGLVDAGRARRPRDINTVSSAAMCEKWRGQVVKEISRKITKIQDPALSDFQLRDLNDEINKLMKEKHVWEIRLKNLGGPNYLHSKSVAFDLEGNSIGSARGYKYFGRARELPGVKELFEEEARKRALKASQAHDRKNAQQLQDFSDLYYGFEDDSRLVEEEAHQMQSFQDDQSHENSHSDGIIPAIRPPSLKQMESYLLERKRQSVENKFLTT